MKKLIFTSSLLLALAITASALSTTYCHPSGQFSVIAPSGWSSEEENDRTVKFQNSMGDVVRVSSVATHKAEKKFDRFMDMSRLAGATMGTESATSSSGHSFRLYHVNFDDSYNILTMREQGETTIFGVGTLGRPAPDERQRVVVDILCSITPLSLKPAEKKTSKVNAEPVVKAP